MGTFLQKLIDNNAAGRYACGGLDPLDTKLPPYLKEMWGEREWWQAWEAMLFKAVLESAEHAAAFKPNIAFFLARGHLGLKVLERLCEHIRTVAPHALLILDMKCGDIGDTNLGYVAFAFNVCGADAITVHPYMGSDAMEPFLKDPDKGVFVLCRTTNKGAEQMQSLPSLEGNYRVIREMILSRSNAANADDIRATLELVDETLLYRALEGSGIYGMGERPSVPYRNGWKNPQQPMRLFQEVARIVMLKWNTNQNCGLVVPATDPTAIQEVLQTGSILPLLIPGIGKQAGDLIDTVRATASTGEPVPFIINQSTGWLYASSGRDFPQASAAVLKKMNDDIVAILKPS